MENLSLNKNKQNYFKNLISKQQFKIHSLNIGDYKMKTKVLFGSVLLLLLCISSVSFANEGKVTFINGAQKAGIVSAKIYFGSSTNFCTVTGTVSHAEGTSAADKATQLAADINAQCVGATASAAGGTVTVTQNGTNEISEIDITDRTNQSKTINPHGLDDDSKKVSVSIEGIGSCLDGSAYLSLDDYGVAASVSIYAKTGSQITDEFAAELSSNPAIIADAVSIISIGFGGNGKLVLQNLPYDKSTITFDGGGDCGLSDVITLGKDEPEVIPTLSEWGVIILLLLVVAVGMVFLYQRQTSLALAGATASFSVGAKPRLFDRKLFTKVFAITLLIGAAGLLGAYLWFGQITTADPFGVFVSAAVVAYMVQLVMLKKEGRG